MAADSTAEIDAPGQGGRDAVGIVFEAAEKAADAADGDADGDGDGEEVAGALHDAEPFLRPFDSDPTTDEATDDGLAGHEEVGVVPAGGEFPGVIQQVKDLAADGGAEDGGHNHPGALIVIQRIGCACALAGVEIEAAGVG